MTHNGGRPDIPRLDNSREILCQKKFPGDTPGKALVDFVNIYLHIKRLVSLFYNPPEQHSVKPNNSNEYSK